jgi:hypothetical protein
MGTVNLDKAESGFDGTQRGIDKALLNAFDLFDGERMRYAVAIVRKGLKWL